MTEDQAKALTTHLKEDFGGEWMEPGHHGFVKVVNHQPYITWLSDAANGTDGPIELVENKFLFRVIRVIRVIGEGKRHYGSHMRFPTEAQARAAYTSWLILSANG